MIFIKILTFEKHNNNNNNNIQRTTMNEISETSTTMQRRYSMLPIMHTQLYDLYTRQNMNFWFKNEINFGQDNDLFKTLDHDTQLFIEKILVFFVAADIIVNINIDEHFSQFGIPEIDAFYAAQKHIEVIHSEVYANMVKSYIGNAERQAKAFSSVHEYSDIAELNTWLLTHVSDTATLTTRLFSAAVFESLFFGVGFASIYYLKHRGIMLPILFLANDFIIKDECLHVDFGITLYNMLTQTPFEKNALVQEIIQVNNLDANKFYKEVECADVESILIDAVNAIEAFLDTALPVRLIGMNKQLMLQYVQYMANQIYNRVNKNSRTTQGSSFVYKNVRNPFDFMEQISLRGKTNFFERKVSDYQRQAVNDDDTDDDHAAIHETKKLFSSSRLFHNERDDFPTDTTDYDDDDLPVDSSNNNQCFEYKKDSALMNMREDADAELRAMLESFTMK